jgi:hypothetical protein
MTAMDDEVERIKAETGRRFLGFPFRLPERKLKQAVQRTGASRFAQSEIETASAAGSRL